jgi:hypothetical protein
MSQKYLKVRVSRNINRALDSSLLHVLALTNVEATFQVQDLAKKTLKLPLSHPTKVLLHPSNGTLYVSFKGINGTPGSIYLIQSHD